MRTLTKVDLNSDYDKILAKKNFFHVRRILLWTVSKLVSSEAVNYVSGFWSYYPPDVTHHKERGHYLKCFHRKLNGLQFHWSSLRACRDLFGNR